MSISKYLYSFLQHEIESFKAQSKSTYFELQTKYGSLQYLKNLEKRYNSAEKFEETCPVCHMSMDEKVTFDNPTYQFSSFAVFVLTKSTFFDSESGYDLWSFYMLHLHASTNGTQPS